MWNFLNRIPGLKNLDFEDHRTRKNFIILFLAGCAITAYTVYTGISIYRDYRATEPVGKLSRLTLPEGKDPIRPITETFYENRCDTYRGEPADIWMEDVVDTDISPRIPEPAKVGKEEALEYRKQEKQSIIMDTLLFTEYGRELLHYATILLGIILSFIVFISFISAWKSINSMKYNRVIPTRPVTSDVLRVGDVLPEYRTKYISGLREKYGYYGSEGTSEFVKWAYDRIILSGDFRLEDQEKIVCQLKWGFINTLRDYDVWVNVCNERRMSFDQQESLVEEIKRDFLDTQKTGFNSEAKHLTI